MKKRILLTGASGFIGRYCLPELIAHGYEVHAVSRKSSHSETKSPVIWHQVDLLQPPELRELLTYVRPHSLLHLAWYTEHGQYWHAKENLDWLRASLDLLEVFAETGGQRIIMTGTCAEYDWSAGKCSELETPLHPSSLYGSAKKALMEVLFAYARQLKLQAAWGRIFFAYGPYEPESRLLPSVIQALTLEQTIPCTAGLQKRDFIYVKDVANALVTLLESTVEGAINIGSGKPTSIKDLIQYVTEHLQANPDLVQWGAIPNLTPEPDSLFADISRLRDELKWTPQWDLSAAIEDYTEFWKQKHNEANHVLPNIHHPGESTIGAHGA